eukprot:s3065_g6.t1
MNVVLTGMAQLQGLVTELATTAKASTKPELVKPGSSILPDLPYPGPEACLLFADWLHDSKPALADVSDSSEVLWQVVLEESEKWYKGYLTLGPMERAGTKDGSPKGKAKGASKGGSAPKATGAGPEVPSSPVAPGDAQQIKSMLADAALILQKANSAGQAQQVEVKAQSTPSGKAGSQSQETSGAPSNEVTQGTPVTLASLNAQLETLRAMTRDFGVRMVMLEELPPRVAAVALLDSGATHAVIPYNRDLQDLDTVPVTLAGDSKEEWWKTKGGTLVVPPESKNAKETKDLQMILPLGALVETLGCKVSWSRRSGLKVVHPTLGTLRTGVGRNTCPFLQEDQALRLISELEEKRLRNFEQEVDNLQYHLESLERPADPTEALRTFARTGERRDALRAVMAQPYFAEAREDIKARLAESIPGRDDDSGKQVLKALPLSRSSRRELLASTRWVVHLCAGESKVNDPLALWAQEQGAYLIRVDLQEKGGKGWDLSQPHGAWRALLWAAATGRIVAVLSSPPPVKDEASLALNLQPMFLWSLSSVTRGKGIPYLLEHALVQNVVPNRFAEWSTGHCVTVGQDPNALRLVTNLDLGFVDDVVVQGRVWSASFKDTIARALSGNPRCQSVESLDRVITKGLMLSGSSPWSEARSWNKDASDDDEWLARAFEEESVMSLSDEEEEGTQPELSAEDCSNPTEARAENQDHMASVVSEVKEMTQAAKDGWKKHLVNGHVPYRRDCRFCVEGAGLGVFHHKVRHPKSFALSVDLFGPVPPAEAGRDESCVTGKCALRYGLVGAFRFPKATLESGPVVEGVRDLFNKGEGEPPVLPLEVDCEEYAPSEPPDQLFPELFEGDLDPGFQRDDVLEAITVDAVTVEGESVFRDVDPFPLPETEEGLKELIGELSSPVEQVVLRFFIPLRSKTGPEVTEAVQRMILGIMKDYPITSIHHDPGTEFSSISLSRWLSEKGIRVQHSLPTDKRGNGLAERTVGWVLHRVKRPSDGTKQLMERWVEEEDSAVLPPSHLPDEGDLESAAPSRRLRIKSKVRFVDLDDQDLGEVERRARVFLLEDDFSDEAFRVIVQMLRDCERPSKDRRGDLQEKFVFGAFCHGGNRGVTVVSAKGDSDDASSITDSSLPDLEPVDAGPGQQDLPYDLGEPSSEVSLEQDMQIDSVTQLIGWDPSQGEGHNYPVQNLEETDLQQYLDDRGVGWTFRRLVNLGVEMASDLAFLFQEDLVEFGIPPQDARRIMIGIHPAGTVRPDNPNLSSLTSPPAYGLGVRDPRLGPEAFEEDWVVSEERRRNEERWIQYTDLPSMSASSSTALPPLGTESVDFPPAQVQTLDVTQGNDQVPPQGDLWFSDYEGYAEYAMAMQAMWDEEEGFSDIGEGQVRVQYAVCHQ